MSRIGNSPVTIAEGVQVEISDTNLVTVKGTKGTLTQQVHPSITIKVEGAEMTFERKTNQKQDRSMHGLYRSLINNMVEGVSKGFTKKLELVGVGYRAAAKGQLLELSLGFSHPIAFHLPDEIKVSAETVKGKNPIITLESYDKQLLGQVAAKIRSLRKPEPYKGKGVKYVGEQIRRKAGKSAAK